MSRNTQRRKAKVHELAEELTIGAALRLRVDSDSIRPIIDAVVQYLIEEYPSQDLYIPSSVTYPVIEVRAAVASGASIRSVCRKFRLSRRTVYMLLGDDSAQAM